MSRYYDPETCRYINADSNIAGGDDTRGFNMFAYCGNDPVNRVDPTGEFWLLIAAILLTGAVIEAVQDIREMKDKEVDAVPVYDEYSGVLIGYKIKNSHYVTSPIVMFFYCFYLNYIRGDTKDYFQGSTMDMVYEWAGHSIGYDFTSDDGLKDSFSEVNINSTLFHDNHSGALGFALKLGYFVLFPLFAIYDYRVANGE